MSGRALISLTFHVAFEPSVALSRQHRALRVSLFETSQDGVGACCMPLAGADHSIGRPLLRAWLEQCLRAERQARQCHLSLNPFLAQSIREYMERSSQASRHPLHN